MRKFTLLSFLLVFSFLGFAQYAGLYEQYAPGKAGEAQLKTEFQKSLRGTKAVGDTIWYEGFDGCALPSGWSVVDNTGNDFDWIVTDQPPGGNYSGSIPAINSTSAGCFMSLRGDFYNTPMPPTPVDMDAYFQTPAIDLSAYPSVVLRFEQMLRYCCSANNPFKVFVSNDGVNWTEFNVTNGTSVNQTNVAVSAGVADPAEQVEVNISSVAGGQPTVYLRFHKQGASHYFWMVDDIALVEAADHNMVLEERYANFRFTNGGFYSQTPMSQVTAVWFKGAVLNNGAMTQTNVNLNVTVEDQLGAVVWTGDKDTAQISSVMRDTIELDSGFFPDYQHRNTYTATYTVSADDADQFPSDNSQSLSFMVTDSVMAHDEVMNGRISPSNYVGTADGDMVGCTYWLEYDDTVSSLSVYVRSETSVGSPIIKAEVWKYDSGLGDWLLVIDSEEHIIQPEDPGSWVTLTLTDDDGTQKYLAGQANYAAMINCTWGVDTLYFGCDYTPGFHDYTMESALRVGTTWYYMSGVPQVRMNFYRSFISCDPMYASGASTDVICKGEASGTATVDVFGGNGQFTYNWSNGDTTAAVTGLVAGQYYCTVATCDTSTVLEFTINEATAAFEHEVSIVETSCGANTGEITVSGYNGGIPYTYNWSTGATTSSITGLGVGTYGYTITDSFGCEFSGSVTLDVPNSPVISVDLITHETSALNDGAVDISVTGGTGVMSYSWTGPSAYTATTEDISGLAGGWYYVTVTDENSCTGTGLAYVVAYDPACDAFTVVVDSIMNADCYGDMGAIYITAAGGTEPYTYAWTGSVTTEDLVGVAVGNYTVIVTDNAGCIKSTVGMVDGPSAAISASSMVTNVTCYGDNTGAVDVTVTGGTSPYTFSWNTGETTEDLTGIASGSHYLTITDANGCTYNHTENLAQGAQVTITVDDSHGANIAITVAGGTTPYTYLWSNGATTEDISGITAAGAFSVTVTDALGCTAVETNIPASVSEINTAEMVNIYPNPTNGRLNIVNAENSTIRVYNILGDVVAEIKEASSQTVIDLSGKAAGTYVVKVITDNATTTKRIYLVK